MSKRNRIDRRPCVVERLSPGRAPGTFPGGAIDCANAAVDPNDRNHFIYSKGGEYKAWHSEDGGKTVAEYVRPTAVVELVARWPAPLSCMLYETSGQRCREVFDRFVGFCVAFEAGLAERPERRALA